MKNTVRWLAAIAGLGLAGCSSVHVNLRGDIDTAKSNVVVFPMMLVDGHKLKPANTSYSNPTADGQFQKMWTDAVGSENTTVISKTVLDAVPFAYDALNAMIDKMDSTSSLDPATGVAKFLGQVSTKMDGSAVAIALVFEDEKEYTASKHVHVNMGLFDTRRMAWKWMTKHEYSPGFFSSPLPYQTAVANVIAESRAALLRSNSGVLR